MNILNIEIKSKCENPDEIEQILKSKNAFYKGEDLQTDTYFKVKDGRLKLREGKIENSLIFYNRKETKELKKSDVVLYEVSKDVDGLKNILKNLFEVLAVVKKKRKIFFIDNMKFHIDTVDGLGSFIEIEAIDTSGKIGKEKLTSQCNEYIEMLGIDRNNFIDKSYSDLILNLMS